MGLKGLRQGLENVTCNHAVHPEMLGSQVTGQSVEIDAEKGILKLGDRKFEFPGLPPEILAIRDAGGLLPYTLASLEKRVGNR